MPSTDVYLARQPILNRRLELHGYELLARVGPENSFQPSDDPREAEAASIDVLHASIDVFQLETLANKKQIFVKATRSLLLSNLIEVLPIEQTVIELLGTVTPDAEVLEAVRRLKRAGYGIALDGFVPRPELEPLVKLADILKIDFQRTLGEERKAIHDDMAGDGRILLAEKVETQEDVKEAIELGYWLFQGFFFCKPEMFHDTEQPGCRINSLNLLQELGKGELELDRIEEIFRRDPTLSVKLLRYLNSAAFGLRNPITSIRQALVHLGERSLRRWGAMTAMAGLGNDKPSELVTTTLVRARFMEILGHLASAMRNQETFFLVGLLSTLDAMLDRPLKDALAEISVAPQVREALLGDDSRLSRTLGLVTAHERGRWDAAEEFAGRLGLTESGASGLYHQAIQWVDGALAHGEVDQAA